MNEDIEVVRLQMKDVFRDIEKRASQSTLDELKEIGHAFQQYAWKAGWATDKLYQECFANGGMQTVEDCCWYVCVASFGGMRSMNTVKRYLYNARFFSPKTVAKYDAVPFSTFEYARSREGGTTWKKVLDTAVEQFEKYGKPVSVKKLRELLDGKRNDKTPSIPRRLDANVDGYVLQFAESSLDELHVDRAVLVERSAVFAMKAALDTLSSVIPVIAKMFPSLGISASRIVNILRQLAVAIENGQDVEIPVPSP